MRPDAPTNRGRKGGQRGGRQSGEGSQDAPVAERADDVLEADALRDDGLLEPVLVLQPGDEDVGLVLVEPALLAAQAAGGVAGAVRQDAERDDARNDRCETLDAEMESGRISDVDLAQGMTAREGRT